MAIEIYTICSVNLIYAVFVDSKSFLAVLWRTLSHNWAPGSTATSATTATARPAATHDYTQFSSPHAKLSSISSPSVTKTLSWTVQRVSFSPVLFHPSTDDNLLHLQLVKTILTRQLILTFFLCLSFILFNLGGV